MTSIARLAAALLVLAAATPLRAEVGFEIFDDGRTLVYHARPGDSPGAVARALGIPPEGTAAFLAENRITDPTRVPPGFTYRVPNPLATRATAAEERAAALARDVRARDARVGELERNLAAARTTAEANAARDDRLALLETRWRRQLALLVVALLGAAAALWIASLAIGRMREVQRHASALEHDLEQRRAAGLAERQQRERKVLELEEQVRDLQRQLGPRPRLARRGA